MTKIITINGSAEPVYKGLCREAARRAYVNEIIKLMQLGYTQASAASVLNVQTVSS